jgi:hypothetical protein
MLENVEVGYFCQSNFEKLVHSNDFLYESLNKSRLSKLYNYDSSLIKINDICNNHLTNYLSTQIYNFYNNFVISTYINRHLMYMFILDIDLTKLKLKKQILDIFEKRFGHLRIILIKIGYTYHLLDRIQALKKKFKCNVYLIGLKQVNSEHDETIFHKILKENYPELFETLYIEPIMDKKLGLNNVKDKVLSDETYVYNFKLLEEFFNHNIIVKDELAIENEKTLQLDKQIILKDKDIEFIKIKAEYELKLKENEIKLKESELKLRDKDIELIKLQLKLKQV